MTYVLLSSQTQYKIEYFISLIKFFFSFKLNEDETLKSLLHNYLFLGKQVTRLTCESQRFRTGS